MRILNLIHLTYQRTANIFADMDTEIMVRQLGADEVRARLKAMAAQLGSQKALAARAEISDAYLSDVINGRRDPTDAVCRVVGLKRKVVYEEMMC